MAQGDAEEKKRTLNGPRRIARSRIAITLGAVVLATAITLPVRAALIDAVARIKAQGIAALESILERSLSYDSISPNLLTGIEIYGIKLTAYDGDVSKARKVTVGFDLLALITTGKPLSAIRSIGIDGLRVSIDATRDEGLLKLMAKQGGDDASNVEIPHLNFTLRDAEIGYREAASSLRLSIANASINSSDQAFTFSGSIALGAVNLGSLPWLRASLTMNGASRTDLSASRASLTIEGLETSEIALRYLRVIADWRDGIISIDKVPDPKGLVFTASYVPANGEFKASASMDSWIPSSLITLKDSLTSAQPLMGARMSGKAHFSFSSPVLDYSASIKATLPKASVLTPLDSGEICVDASLRGTDSEFEVINLTASSETSTISSHGKLVFDGLELTAGVDARLDERSIFPFSVQLSAFAAGKDGSYHAQLEGISIGGLELDGAILSARERDDGRFAFEAELRPGSEIAPLRMAGMASSLRSLEARIEFHELELDALGKAALRLDQGLGGETLAKAIADSELSGCSADAYADISVNDGTIAGRGSCDIRAGSGFLGAKATLAFDGTFSAEAKARRLPLRYFEHLARVIPDLDPIARHAAAAFVLDASGNLVGGGDALEAKISGSLALEKKLSASVNFSSSATIGSNSRFSAKTRLSGFNGGDILAILKPGLNPGKAFESLASSYDPDIDVSIEGDAIRTVLSWNCHADPSGITLGKLGRIASEGSISLGSKPLIKATFSLDAPEIGPWYDAYENLYGEVNGLRRLLSGFGAHIEVEANGSIASAIPLDFKIGLAKRDHESRRIDLAGIRPASLLVKGNASIGAEPSIEARVLLGASDAGELYDAALGIPGLPSGYDDIAGLYTLGGEATFSFRKGLGKLDASFGAAQRDSPTAIQALSPLSTRGERVKGLLWVDGSFQLSEKASVYLRASVGDTEIDTFLPHLELGQEIIDTLSGFTAMGELEAEGYIDSLEIGYDLGFLAPDVANIRLFGRSKLGATGSHDARVEIASLDARWTEELYSRITNTSLRLSPAIVSGAISGSIALETLNRRVNGSIELALNSKAGIAGLKTRFSLNDDALADALFSSFFAKGIHPGETFSVDASLDRFSALELIESIKVLSNDESIALPPTKEFSKAMLSGSLSLAFDCDSLGTPLAGFYADLRASGLGDGTIDDSTLAFTASSLFTLPLKMPRYGLAPPFITIAQGDSFKATVSFNELTGSFIVGTLEAYGLDTERFEPLENALATGTIACNVAGSTFQLRTSGAIGNNLGNKPLRFAGSYGGGGLESFSAQVDIDSMDLSELASFASPFLPGHFDFKEELSGALLTMGLNIDGSYADPDLSFECSIEDSGGTLRASGKAKPSGPDWLDMGAYANDFSLKRYAGLFQLAGLRVDQDFKALIARTQLDGSVGVSLGRFGSHCDYTATLEISPSGNEASSEVSIVRSEGSASTGERGALSAVASLSAIRGSDVLALASSLGLGRESLGIAAPFIAKTAGGAFIQAGGSLASPQIDFSVSASYDLDAWGSKGLIAEGSIAFVNGSPEGKTRIDISSIELQSLHELFESLAVSMPPSLLQGLFSFSASMQAEIQYQNSVISADFGIELDELVGNGVKGPIAARIEGIASIGNEKSLEFSLVLPGIEIAKVYPIAALALGLGEMPSYLEGARLSANAYCSTDFIRFSYSAPRLFVTSERLGGAYALFALSGTQSIMNLSSASLFIEGQSIGARGSATFDSGIDFDLSATWKGREYRVSGFSEPGGAISFSGNYGTTGIISFERGIEFSLSISMLPIPLTNGIDPSLSGTFSGRVADGGQWSVSFANASASRLNGIAGSISEAGGTGDIDASGIRFEECWVLDSVSRLSGRGKVDFLNPEAIGLSLELSSRDEGIAIDATFDMERLKAFPGEYSLEAHFSRQSPDRFANLPVKGLATGFIKAKGGYGDPSLEFDISLPDGYLGDKRLSLSTSGSYEKGSLILQDSSLSYDGQRVRNLRMMIDAVKGTASIAGSADLRLETTSIRTGISAKGSFSPIGADIASIAAALENPLTSLGAIRLEGSFDKASYGSLEIGAGPFMASYADGHLHAVLGVGGAFEADFDASGEFSIRAREPLFARGRASGILRDGIIDAIADIDYCDFPSLWALTRIDTVRPLSGSFSGKGIKVSGALSDPDFSAEIMAKSLSIAIPDWVKGASGPIDAKVHVEGKEAKVDLVRTSMGSARIAVAGGFEFQNWLPYSFKIDVKTEQDNFLGVGFSVAGVRIEEGKAACDLSIRGEGSLLAFTGKVDLESAIVSLAGGDQAGGDPGDIHVDLTVSTGGSVQFKYPSSATPIVSGYAVRNRALSVRYSGSTGDYLVRGDLGIRGTIFYFENPFTIREGSISFNESPPYFDPRISARAERLASKGGQRVTIYIDINRQPISTLTLPDPYSDPPMAREEILALMGLRVDGSGGIESVLSTSELLTQLYILAPFEGIVRESLGLDLFSIQSPVIQNFIGDVSQGSDPFRGDFSTIFKDTTIIMGKYLGNDVFAQLQLGLEEGEEETAGLSGLIIRSELGLDLKTPYFNLRWNFVPNTPENLFLTDMRFTFSWSLYF